jgi:hypothetical protein
MGLGCAETFGDAVHDPGSGGSGRWFGRFPVFRLVMGALATSERSERVLIEAIGEQERGIYALIAMISGSMPKIFMTRVRL